jgi:hypothetical protein
MSRGTIRSVRRPVLPRAGSTKFRDRAIMGGTAESSGGVLLSPAIAPHGPFLADTWGRIITMPDGRAILLMEESE